MSDSEPTRLRCDDIAYRSGFIEVRRVHASHVNLEVWSLDPDAVNVDAEWVTDVPDNAVTGNVELELSVRSAIMLADSLHVLAIREPATEDDHPNCDECGSPFFSSLITMSALCPECSHYLYGKPNCAHSFCGGRCRRCGWDGSVSEHVASIKGTAYDG
ncbi:hypothetical protein LF1_53180 [Rubripirellula obstinata]|uniref:Uncharacterized protein n=1 Tax=Rubripirellula obstinata TaxID=406547 RepID=A0A5B1CCN3_9BACT|nr:hypothetical protein [Rubripirellula obstinata]KAA1257469.1 hypothetical protein LF1_53180 [Rubripirellula obstinata]